LLDASAHIGEIIGDCMMALLRTVLMPYSHMPNRLRTVCAEPTWTLQVTIGEPNINCAHSGEHADA
jgi:hypothetical protein